MSMWTDAKNALTFHGDPGRFGNVQKWMDMPGSPVALMHGISMNKWNAPYGSERNSADEIMGGGSSSSSGARSIGRAVGTAFIPFGGAAKSAYGLTQSGGGQSTNNIFSAAPGLMGNQGQQSNTMLNMMNSDPNLYNANAQDLASKGRNGDEHLLHITDDELNQLKATGKLTQNPNTGLPEAFNLGGTFSQVAGPIGQLIGQNQNRQDLSGIADKASNASNPLAAPQRQGFQNQLNDLFTSGGAQNFMENDPSVQAQRRMIGDTMQANFAKSGNMPLNEIMGSAQLANAFGGQYNQRIQDLTTLGGYNQGNPYGGMPYSSLMPMANQGNSANMGAIGSMIPMIGKGLGSLFGNGGGGGDMGTGNWIDEGGF